MTEDIFSFAGSQWLRDESSNGVILWSELLDDPNQRDYYRYRSDTSRWYFRLAKTTKYEKCDSIPYIELCYQVRRVPLPVLLALATLEHYKVELQ